MATETVTSQDLRASANTLDYLKDAIENTNPDTALDDTLRTQVKAYLSRAAIVMRAAADQLEQTA